MLREDSTPDIKIAAFTFINAIVQDREDADLKGRKKFLDKLLNGGLVRTIEKLREIPTLPDNLVIQLDTFEANNEIPEEYMRIDRESMKKPEEVLELLNDQFKGNAIYKNYLAVLNHLILVRKTGRPGYVLSPPIPCLLLQKSIMGAH